MNQELSTFAARLRVHLIVGDDVRSLCSINGDNEPRHVGSCDNDFNHLALELFALQFKHNLAYRKNCEARKLTPQIVKHWTHIPFVPTAAFKELELTSLAPEERAAVFYSSGTTEQKPSRHFHSAESLVLYETSLWSWFEKSLFDDLNFKIQNSKLICLTPPPEQAPNSSLVHMFEVIREKTGAAKTAFIGKISEDGAWTLNFDAALDTLKNPQSAIRNPQLILGTAFSFVHLLDFLAEKNLQLQVPENSRVMETGGYKNRSRSMTKEELHSLITKFLGVPRENIICEYGMSELSSQAYSVASDEWQVTGNAAAPGHSSPVTRHFSFPAWARTQIISPETGRAVADGETGLIRIFDLANVFSVAAIQTEDLGIRRGDGFELVGRAQVAEPRGCSLMQLYERQNSQNEQNCFEIEF